jgi:hypothetical protein
MLSVVLYGRNDSHGYNLHKRAAISLNAIAELLTDPDDEILFVDYNTPDELPTFPEAIADTLTQKAVERLRILRVRPDAHRERFAARTHLVALEPIARNVAIRRSNPANRWVLSTNTDMIFCPRQAGQTLTSIAAALEDGFYHLPRFELPEGLWETVDRKDAAGIIASVRGWGSRFHLNEITHSGSDNLYDGPGDFQLFLRDDLFAIGGFHEEMIRGWHLDANVARRMRLLRGKVSSALEHLVGYHCDHTRQASAYHKADRLENDPIRFVDEVTRPEVSEQMDSWGLPDVTVESFRVDEASAHRYLKGLTSVIGAPLEGFLETAYVAEHYGRLGYDADHVLPYLLDLVSCVPQTSVIGYAGARRDLFEGLAKGWAAMGGTRPIAVPDTAPWLAEAGGGAPVQVLPLEAWLDQADLFIFEVGAERAKSQTEVDAEESVRLWAVDWAFKSAAARDFDRQRKGAAARRAFVVNGIHNFFEPLVFRAIAVTLTPFSTRIRHGYFADRSLGRMASTSPAQKAVAARLGALEPLSLGEMKRIREMVADLDMTRAAGDAWRAAAKLSGEIAAIAAVDASLLGPVERLPEMLDMLSAHRPSRTRAAGGLIAPDAGCDAPNRLARLEDWDDPQWAALAGWLYGTVDHANLFSRERWMWERVTLTQNLMRDLPPGAGGRVLLAGREPEAHAHALAQMGYEVDIIDPASLADGKLDAADWRQRYAHDGWMTPHPLGLARDRAAAIAGGFRYDAVLVLQNGLFILGRGRAADILRGAAALVRPGGHLGFTATGLLALGDNRLTDHALPPSLMREGRFAHEIDAATELELRGAVDDRLTPRTFDRMDEGDGASQTPALVQGSPAQPETAAAFAFRRREGPAGDWSRIARALASGIDAPAQGEAKAAKTAATDPFLFSDLEDLPPSAGGPARFGRLMEAAVIAKDGVRRTPQGLTVSLGPEPHMALHLDVGRLEPGGYQLLVELFVPPGGGVGPLLALGLVSGDKVVAQHVEPGGTAGPRLVDFYFELDQAAAAKGLRLAVKALGGDFNILDMTLR